MKKPQEENNRSSLQFMTENLYREGNHVTDGRCADYRGAVYASESPSRLVVISTKTQVGFSDPSRRIGW